MQVVLYNGRKMEEVVLISKDYFPEQVEREN